MYRFDKTYGAMTGTERLDFGGSQSGQKLVRDEVIFYQRADRDEALREAIRMLERPSQEAGVQSASDA